MALPSLSCSIVSAATQVGAILAPIILYGIWHKSKPLCLASLLTIAFYLLQTAILASPNLVWFSAWKYNWLQKVIVIWCTFVFARRLSLSKEDCGFVFPRSFSAYAVGFIVGIIFIGFDAFNGMSTQRPPLETLLFQFTMPGLHEELFFRGLLLQIWDKHAGRPWRGAGVQFGIGSIITSAIFTAAHITNIDNQWHMSLNTDMLFILDLMLFALAMCWLRYRFKSVVPAVIAHNTNNGLEQLYAWFMNR